MKSTADLALLDRHLAYLCLSFVRQHCQSLATEAARKAKKINRLQIQDLFRLQFIEDKANVIFLGLVGVGKSHLATALGYAACLRGNAFRG